LDAEDRMGSKVVVSKWHTYLPPGAYGYLQNGTVDTLEWSEFIVKELVGPFRYTNAYYNSEFTVDHVMSI
jgi:hypothetical protein